MSTTRTQHTPGPWRAEQRLTDWLIAVGPVTWETTHGPRLIAQDINRESDARLIAAAPALLEALERIASAVEDNQRRKVSTHPDWLVTTARHAIRAARGEA